MNTIKRYILGKALDIVIHDMMFEEARMDAIHPGGFNDPKILPLIDCHEALTGNKPKQEL